jgi:hypothetical protein
MHATPAISLQSTGGEEELARMSDCGTGYMDHSERILMFERCTWDNIRMP